MSNTISIRVLLCLSLGLLILGACTGPREDVVPRDTALRWHDPLEVRVLNVYDGLHHSRDPQVSHIVEVEILESSQDRSMIGRRMALPYDQWMAGGPPPKRGTVLVMRPAQWVERSRDPGRRSTDR
ncbi:MAG: hypothetical protein EA401_07625 [Planctomycetota bacterium]|nr:MAG: hypothetical protein EA401_07625 [Planctomycetota bacterium]